jgi:hypothetical protein
MSISKPDSTSISVSDSSGLYRKKYRKRQAGQASRLFGSSLFDSIPAIPALLLSRGFILFGSFGSAVPAPLPTGNIFNSKPASDTVSTYNTSSTLDRDYISKSFSVPYIS